MARPSVTDQRRQQILEAAASVIAARGVCDARIADIAELLDISPALVLYYFSSKDDLLAEALTHRDEQFFEGVAEASAGVDSAAARLRMVIEASCPPDDPEGSSDSEWHLWLDMWTRSRHDPALAEARSRMDRMFRTVVSGIVGDGVAAGEFDASADPDSFAILLTSLIDGLAIQVLLGDDAVDAATMRRLCLDMAASQLGAVMNGA